MRTLKITECIHADVSINGCCFYRAAMSTPDSTSVYLIATNVQGNMEVMSSRLQGGQLNPGAKVCVGVGPDGLRKCKYNYKHTCKVFI